LHIALMGRFCILFKNKTAEGYMQVPMRVGRGSPFLHFFLSTSIKPDNTISHSEILKNKGRTMCPNGPAIWGGCVTRRKHRAGSWYPEYSGPERCHGARRVWRTFCHPGTKLVEHYACRGTSLIGAANLSPVTKLVAGTGAVSRYNVERSQ